MGKFTLKRNLEDEMGPYSKQQLIDYIKTLETDFFVMEESLSISSKSSPNLSSSRLGGDPKIISYSTEQTKKLQLAITAVLGKQCDLTSHTV